jgi:hypothetical protein
VAEEEGEEKKSLHEHVDDTGEVNSRDAMRNMRVRRTSYAMIKVNCKRGQT